MSGKYTPGPWKVFVDDDDVVGIEHKGGVVCSTMGIIIKEDEADSANLLADARLIAKSPVLFEACKEAIEVLDDIINAAGNNQPYTAEELSGFGIEALDKLQEAIANIEEE